MKRWLAGAVMALVGVALAACGAASPKADPQAADQVAEVTHRPLDVKAEASGTVQPVLIVEVKSKASGEILKLHAETGEEVKKGTLLAEIDPRDVSNALSQAQADLEVARVRLQTSSEQLKRSEQLRKSNVITEQEYETAALDEANARAQLVKAQTNLELAQQRMGDVTIRAPIDGTLIEKDVEAGQIIASASQTVSGGTTLFKMADLSTMQVRALVDETDIGRVQPHQVARVTVDAYPNRVFTGAVEKIEPQAVVDQNVTMFPVLITLDNGEKLLKPGMNADVEVQVARRDNALVVPNDAVVSMREAATVGTALGLSEDQVQKQLAGTVPVSDPPAQGAKAAPGQAPQGAAGQQPAAPGQVAAAGAPGQGASADCMALVQKIRAAGGFQAMSSLSEQDRTKLRACRGQFGGGRGGPGGRGDGTRPAVVFVQTAQGPEARRVVLGVNDFDYTEVLRGLKDGEKVILASVARLQQQQTDMQNRIRERTGGPLRSGGR